MTSLTTFSFHSVPHKTNQGQNCNIEDMIECANGVAEFPVLIVAELITHFLPFLFLFCLSLRFILSPFFYFFPPPHFDFNSFLFQCLLCDYYSKSSSSLSLFPPLYPSFRASIRSFFSAMEELFFLYYLSLSLLSTTLCIDFFFSFSLSVSLFQLNTSSFQQ